MDRHSFVFLTGFCSFLPGTVFTIPLVDPVEVMAAKGSSAELFCDIELPNQNNNTSSSQNDRLTRVLWFKDGDNVPLYAYYIKKQKEQSSPKRWSDQKLLGSRGFFHVDSSPTRLEIKNFTVSDEGLYKCRVDFKKAPTRITEIQLSLIVPPEKPVITEINRSRQERAMAGSYSMGEDLSRTVGPYELGEDVTVLCTVLGGKPTPNLTWSMDHQPVKEQLIRATDEKVESSLFLPSVSPSDRGTLLTCRADNGYTKVYTSVKLELRIVNSPNEKQLNLQKNIKEVFENTLVETKEEDSFIFMTSKSCINHGPLPLAILIVLWFLTTTEVI